MAIELDAVATYGAAIGLAVLPRTILVEGTTDVAVYELAARLEYQKTGSDLYKGLAIVAAGVRDQGGTKGVIRELVGLRALSRACLLPNGRPKYRFVGLFDNDTAGQHAVRAAREIDSSILEYKDVFRLWPLVPIPGNLDQGTVQRAFERANEPYKGLKWELEDMLPTEFIDGFQMEYPKAIIRTNIVGNRIHREFTEDGKAKLHRFIRQHAIHKDLTEVIAVLKAFRYYLGIETPKQD